MAVLSGPALPARAHGHSGFLPSPPCRVGGWEEEMEGLKRKTCGGGYGKTVEFGVQ